MNSSDRIVSGGLRVRSGDCDPSWISVCGAFRGDFIHAVGSSVIAEGGRLSTISRLSLSVYLGEGKKMKRLYNKIMIAALMVGLLLMDVAASFAQSVSIDTQGLQDAAISGVNTLFDQFVAFLPVAMIILAVGAGLGIAFTFGRRLISDFVKSLQGGGM